MRQISFIAFAGTLALLLTGCPATPDAGGGEASAPQSPAGTSAASPAGTPAAQTVAVQPFAPQTVVRPSPIGTLPPDLIRSTNIDQQVRGIQRNRPDPFALLPTNPIVEIPRQETSQAAPSLPTQPQVTQPNLPSILAPIPNLIPTPPPIVMLPPQPTLARAVAVTGVVQIGNTLNAIIKAPNEPSSRYVRVGQLLSNGQVLVKRIELNEGAEPVVVFEQNGIEVITAVGEGGPPSTSQPGTPTAAAIASPQLAAIRPL